MIKCPTNIHQFIYFFLTALFFAASTGLEAQSRMKVTGTVFDEGDMAIAYAAVAAYSLPDSSLASGTSTDMDGKFTVELKPGTYYIHVTYLSYEDLFLPAFTVEEKNIDLGRSTMLVSSAMLEEVVITEERSRMELQLDKKVFHIGKDLGSTGSNAADILDRVPSVNVDVEGNISLRGSGNVRILVNGKPSGLVQSGDPQSLRQLQGSLIESIEVITNPSSKYDAEGEVGIINLVLKEDKRKGVNGSFDVHTGYPNDHGAAVNLNYRRNKVNIFLSEGISWDKNPGGGVSFQEYFFPDTTYAYDRDYDQTRSDLSNNLRLGADFFITEKDIITLSGLYQYSTGKNLSTTRYTDYNSEGDQTGIIERYQDELEIEHTVEADLSYRKEFEEKDREFTIDMKFYLGQDTEDAQYDENDFSTGQDVDVIQRSDNLEYEKSWLFQTDYVHPFGNEGKLETGLKADLRNVENDFLVEELTASDSWETIPGFDNDFIYKENIYSAYASAGEKFNWFSIQAGLRMEYSDIRTELVKTEETNPRSYVDFFPSVFTGYEIREHNTIQAGYSRRISRPNFWSLLPFFQYSDTRNYWSGNPDLNPEYTHSFELGYQRIFEHGSLLTTAYYRHRTGVIERVTFVDTSGIQRTLPVNLATEDNFGLEFNINYDIFDWWNINGNANFYRAVLRGDYDGENYNNDTYSGDFKVSTKFNVVEILDIQASFNYRSPRKTSQGRVESSYYFDMGASLDVLKKRGTITLSVRDLFDTRSRNWYTEGENFRTEGEFQWRRARQVKLSFNYRLERDR